MFFASAQCVAETPCEGCTRIWPGAAQKRCSFFCRDSGNGQGKQGVFCGVLSRSGHPVNGRALVDAEAFRHKFYRRDGIYKLVAAWTAKLPGSRGVLGDQLR